MTRLKTEIEEFDRVVGNGLPEGVAVLIAGNPGIGKSTLVLQISNAMTQHGDCLYVTGEESIEQISLRASRLKIENEDISIMNSTSTESVIEYVHNNKSVKTVIIDSIQTMYSEKYESIPGTVTQVRTTSELLISLAKKKNIVLILVGHVTKEGQIAGPRLLEHMVDTVLYFEGLVVVHVLNYAFCRS